MDTFLGRYKNLVVLAAILFAQIIGLALQVRRPVQTGGETRLIRLWAISAVTPIEGAVVHAQKWAHWAWSNYAYLRGVRRENRELRAQIERMKIDEARLSEDARMARRVQTLLAFKEQYVENTIAAQVIGTSGSEQSRVLYLDKGSRDGIKTDMAVITPNGIVGKIVQVFPTSSQVLPINDQFSGVGAMLKDTRLQGILKGAQNGTTTLQYIMSDEKVEPGEEVLTSGGDRIFPKGLPAGKVATVEPGKDLFLNIRVVPAARLDQVEEVLIVTKIMEKMPDAKDLAPIRAADILAERLPTVPTKPANAATGTSTPAGTAAPPNAARPAATGTASNKPAGGAATLPGAKPTGVATIPRSTQGTTAVVAPGTAAGTAKPGATTPAEQLTGVGTTATGSIKPKATPAQSAPVSGAAPSKANPQTPLNDDTSTPPPKKAQPPPEQTPPANPDQVAKPPAAEPPQP